MSITAATASHAKAQHAGVTAKSVNPAKSNPASGVQSIPVYSDMGELGSMLFGHTIADSVNRTETGTTARQTELGGFVPLAKTKLSNRKATVAGSAASVDPGATNRTAQIQANQVAAATRRQVNNLLAAGRRRVNNAIAYGKKLPTVSNGSQPVNPTPWNGQQATYVGQQPN